MQEQQQIADMAARGWSASQHISALSNLASKLEKLERQAELLDSIQAEEETQASGTHSLGTCSGCLKLRVKVAAVALSGS